MDRFFKISLLFAAVTFIGLAEEANAQQRESITARSGSASNSVVFRSNQTHRVDDRGRPLCRWCQQVTYRATNDTFVYRKEGVATTRHDEVSSPAIIFHVKGGSNKVKAGHVYQKRGN